MTDEFKTCENCTHWRHLQDEIGECCHSPPVIVLQPSTTGALDWRDLFAMTAWPITAIASTCGRWQHNNRITGDA